MKLIFYTLIVNITIFLPCESEVLISSSNEFQSDMRRNQPPLFCFILGALIYSWLWYYSYECLCYIRSLHHSQ
jgi:hypothetical protein